MGTGRRLNPCISYVVMGEQGRRTLVGSLHIELSLATVEFIFFICCCALDL